MADFKLEIDDKALTAGFVDFTKANAIATRRTLDTQVALSRRNYLDNVKGDFTLRNTFVRRSIQFDKVDPAVSRLENMEARVGSKAPFMELQEEGGVKRPKSGGRLAIPMNAARGGSNAMVVSKAFYLRKMRNRQMVSGNFKRDYRSRKARNVARMAVAYEKKKFIKRNDGIYRVDSFRARGGRVRIRMQRLYNVENATAKIKPTHHLEDAIKKPVKDGPNIHRSQIKKLLKADII
jgi:hypothetical protein